MKFVIKASLALLAVGAIAGIYYADDLYSEREEKQKDKEKFALFFVPSDVVKFSFKNAQDEEFIFARAKVTDDWKIISHNNVTADQNSVNNLLSAMSSINVNQELSATKNAPQEEVQENFGFKQPLLSLSVTLAEGKVLTLNVGKELNMGTKANSILQSLSAYALTPERPNVLVISNTILSATRGKTLEMLRTKQIAAFDLSDVGQLELTSVHGDISLLKKEGQWQIAKPKDFAADAANITSYLLTLKDLKAEKVTEAKAVTAALKKQTHLDVPTASITLKDGAGTLLLSLPIGMTKDGIFIILEDGAIAQLSLEKWTSIIPSVKFFRDKQVVKRAEIEGVEGIKIADNIFYKKRDNDWFKVTDAGQEIATETQANMDAAELFSHWEFMAADDIVDEPSTADLKKFGLEKPLKTFSFLFKPEEKKLPLTIIIGNRVPFDEKSVYVKKIDSKEVYIVDAQWLDLLSKL